MPTRNVVLTKQQDELVDHLVTSGRFQNASEALRAGLRLLEAEEAEMAGFVERLNAGFDEAMRGSGPRGLFRMPCAKHLAREPNRNAL